MNARTLSPAVHNKEKPATFRFRFFLFLYLYGVPIPMGKQAVGDGSDDASSERESPSKRVSRGPHSYGEANDRKRERRRIAGA